MHQGWSEGKYWSFIRSILRRGFQRYPPKYVAKNRAKQGRGLYLCEACGDTYRNRDVSVDHIVPCGSLKEFDDLPGFVGRLFCEVDGLQVLCSECHHIKSQHERGLTDGDIAVARFRKLAAKEQRTFLESYGIEPGSNQAKREKQYREWLKENDS